MSTAILISGQLRTFAQCYPTQRWHVFRHFPDSHFFITVQDTSDCQSIDLLTADYGADHVHPDVRADPVLEVTPQILAAYDFAPYANAAPAHQLLLQHWYQNEVWKHFQSFVTEPSRSRATEDTESIPLQGSKPPTLRDLSSPSVSSVSSVSRSEKFDTIIRIRPDQWFHSFDLPAAPPARVVGRDMITGLPVMDCPSSALRLLPSEAWTPWWGCFGGINDRFAILGREAARAYFTVYDRIPELLAEYHCPFHPESLVKAALETAGCTIHETLRTEFTTLRQDGNHRPPEIMPWDIAHAALRAA